MRPILLTGADGFVGSYVIRFVASSAGQGVIGAWGCGAAPRETQGDSRIQWIPLCLPGSVSQLEHRVSTVVHIAGEKRVKARMFTVNVEGTEALIARCIALGAERIVFLSSVAVYGEVTLGSRVDESMSPSPHTTYGRTKFEAENLVQELADRAGLPWIILRPSIVIGHHFPAETPLLGFIRSVAKKRFWPIRGRDGILNITSVESVARAVWHAVSGILDGRVLNVCTPIHVSRAAQSVREALGWDGSTRMMPYGLALAASAVGSVASLVPGVTAPFSVARLRSMTSATAYSGDRLGASPGFEYEDIAVALGSMAHSYWKRGLLA